MARKRSDLNLTPIEVQDGTTEDAQALKQVFVDAVVNQFGTYVAPASIITPTNIKPFDALIGGGIASSSPVILSSPAEVGKSTFAYQFVSQFQQYHPNSLTVYLDTETAPGKNNIPRYKFFNIDESRFLYIPFAATLPEVFNLLSELIERKHLIKQELKKDVKLLFILDSLSNVPASKTYEVESAEKMTGYKARELTFLLQKYNVLLKREQVTFVMIDQVRANLRDLQNFFRRSSEKNVTEFGDYKAATGVAYLHHAAAQWLYLSEGSQLLPSDNYGVDGYILKVKTIKCKHAASRHTIDLIFDKTYGIDKFWTEYHFLKEMTTSEKKIYEKPDKLPYPLLITTTGNRRKLTVIDPDTNKVLYEASFFEKEAKTKYNSDEKFREFFDKAVDFSVRERITKGIMKVDMSRFNEQSNVNVDNNPTNDKSSD